MKSLEKYFTLAVTVLYCLQGCYGFNLYPVDEILKHAIEFFGERSMRQDF